MMSALSNYTALTIDEDHVYRVGEHAVPGVSEILDCVGLRRWGGKWRSIGGGEYMGGYEVERDFGHALHGYIGMRLTGHHRHDIDYDPAMLPWIEGWEHFHREHACAETVVHGSRLMVERPLYSRRLGFAGTPDWCVRFDGRPVIVD